MIARKDQKCGDFETKKTQNNSVKLFYVKIELKFVWIIDYR